MEEVSAIIGSFSFQVTPFSTLNPFNSPLGPTAALSYRCEAINKNILELDAV